ncbi:MAG: hypothetical protein KAI24_19660 [Planctomycetes bacterium]|nr:hypothetical protein [Planctomycetota bacterium]
MLRDVGGTGFPTLVFLDADGKVVHKQGARTVDAFRASIKSLKVLNDKSASPRARLEAGLEIGAVSAEEGRAMLAKIKKISAEEKQRIEAKLMETEISEVLAKGRRTPPAEMLKKLNGYVKAGAAPTDGNVAINFWNTMLGAAIAEKDVATAKKSLAMMEKLLEGETRYERYLEGRRKAVEALGDGE